MNPVMTPLNPSVAAPPPHPDIFVDNATIIPGWVRDHESYRHWAVSDDYPESGWVSFIDGSIYVDMNMEELFTHNQVKQAFNVGIGSLLIQRPTGRFFPDRMLFTNLRARVTTEPDGLYAHWATMQSKALRFVPGKKGGILELEGTSDMVLEIVSRYSENKDTVKLRARYEQAGIPEYWLVDARGDVLSFQILRLSNDAYSSVAADEGWTRSEVFNCSFRLVRATDPLGHPLFSLEVKT